MTNTHITLGGHKITTNKVGQVHSITTLLNGYTGTVVYCVTNGICHVATYGITASQVLSGVVKICEGLPKAKMSAFATRLASTNPVVESIIYINVNTTDLIGTSLQNLPLYLCISYPVADDWVES